MIDARRRTQERNGDGGKSSVWSFARGCFYRPNLNLLVAIHPEQLADCALQHCTAPLIIVPAIRHQLARNRRDLAVCCPLVVCWLFFTAVHLFWETVVWSGVFSSGTPAAAALVHTLKIGPSLFVDCGEGVLGGIQQ